MSSSEWVAAVTRLRRQTAAWIEDAAGAAVGVVVARAETGWVPLWVRVMTFEDSSVAPPEVARRGLDDVFAMTWHVGATGVEGLLDSVQRLALDVPGIGEVALLEPTSVQGPAAVPRIDRWVASQHYPLFVTEAVGAEIAKALGENRHERWERRLPAQGLNGVEGLFMAVGARDDTGSRPTDQTRVLVCVPRYFSITRARCDGDHLHVEVSVPRPEKHPTARLAVFAAKTADAIASVDVSRMTVLPSGKSRGWTVEGVPPSGVGVVAIENDEVLHQEGATPSFRLPPMLKRDDGSYWTGDSEVAARLHEALFLLEHARGSPERGRTFEALVRDVLHLAGLDPHGSVRVAGRQLDDAVVLGGRVVLVEVTTASDLPSYLDHVRGRLAEVQVQADTRCIVFVPDEPSKSAIERVLGIGRTAFVTSSELRLFLGGVFRLSELLLWHLKKLDLGSVFVGPDEFLAEREPEA